MTAMSAFILFGIIVTFALAVWLAVEPGPGGRGRQDGPFGPTDRAEGP